MLNNVQKSCYTFLDVSPFKIESDQDQDGIENDGQGDGDEPPMRGINPVLAGSVIMSIRIQCMVSQRDDLVCQQEKCYCPFVYKVG